jgi:hypothetical protein
LKKERFTVHNIRTWTINRSNNESKIDYNIGKILSDGLTKEGGREMV